MFELTEIFGPDGLLAQRIQGYSQRPQQQQMAEAVARILEQGGVLVCEAGTGTGKTFAYLAPALLSGLKVIISTGTKNLQDQLFHRDLPLVREALASPVSVALLKGRANYLCIHRLDTTLVEGIRLTKEQSQQLQRIRVWSTGTRSGDIAEMSEIPEDAGIWPLVTSSTDNCLGQECPAYSKCHLVEARRRAQEADLVVINHHLLCADMALKEEGFGELLPAVDCFILDEAHQLPEVAGNFFGLSAEWPAAARSGPGHHAGVSPGGGRYAGTAGTNRCAEADHPGSAARLRPRSAPRPLVGDQRQSGHRGGARQGAGSAG